ncbi:hypothetical protein ACFLUQ_00445 [Chloroflexota bacterium]
MKVHFMPKTLLGKLSIGLAVAFIVLFIELQLFIASGQRDSYTFISGLLLTIPVPLAGISGISAFLTGIIGVINSRERSVLVFLSTMIGLFVLLFLLGEVLFSH